MASTFPTTADPLPTNNDWKLSSDENLYRTMPTRFNDIAAAINAVEALLIAERNVVAKSADYTVTAAEGVFEVTTGASAKTMTLPTAVGIKGRRYSFKKMDNGAGGVVIDGAGTEIIDGATTLTLTTQWNYATIISDGTNWIVLNSKIG